MRRLPEGGLIDRDRPVPFTFDGRRMTGFAGDTLASALLAGGVGVVGRSFKYHRPRGVFAGAEDEPNALMTIGSGARARPNIQATLQELFPGLEAQSQNRFPHRRFDLGRAADLLHPFLGAGFYYKTFMWPPAWWEKVYEPLIRRAAGLGRLSGQPDPEPCDKAFAHCDLLVIGAGPTGLTAALAAARAGLRVILAEADARPGGRLLSEREEVGGQPGALWAADVARELAALPNVTCLFRTIVTGAYDGGTWGALERVTDHLPARPEGAPRQTFWRIAARRAILAAGAHERPIAFPGNDRPGVMLAGAVRGLLHRHAVAPRRAAVFTACDDGWRTAADLAARGVEVAALIDQRPDARPPEGPWRTIAGGAVTATRGWPALSGITVRNPGGEARFAVDCLAVAGGWSPAVHLSCHLGARPVWDEDLAAFLPAPDAVPGLEAAGAAAGRLSTAGALESGAAAAARAAGALGHASAAAALPAAGDAPARQAPPRAVDARGRAWLDLQNDVTVKDVRRAAAEAFTSVEHMKRYTTLGMATDQGRTANLPGLAVLADATGRTIPGTGTTTFRPPYAPVDIAALGAGGAGARFAPHRLPPGHAVSTERGARFVEAGLWHRAAWYPETVGETWAAACAREARRVRAAAGVTEVSTLGKIEVAGPDAARLLDLVYTGTLSTLAPGRVRYALMLREDGFAMDDGTVARLGPERFVLTTTTGAAAEVLAHLEFAAQCHLGGAALAVTDVTEAWAQFAVAGPRAREVLAAVAGADAARLPFMGCAEVTLGEAPARVFRVSFSGELGFEIAVPARLGAALFHRLIAEAEAHGGGVYGLEALNVLRIEKGLLTHAEIDGRVTAADLGLGRMVAPGKDCIGKAMAARPALTDPDRPQLVGFVPLDAGQRLTGGAHLVARGAAPVRTEDQGHLTSVCHSPHLGHMIALGFLKGGRARIGEVVDAVDLVRGGGGPVRVTALPLLDPEGARARG